MNEGTKNRFGLKITTYNGKSRQQKEQEEMVFPTAVSFVFLYIIFLSLGKGRDHQGKLINLNYYNDFGFVGAFSLTVFNLKSSIPRPQRGHAGVIWSCDDDNNNIPDESVVSYRSLIDILSSVDYMSTETKDRFLKSLKEGISDVAVSDEFIVDSPVASITERKSIEGAESKAEEQCKDFPTIEGPWKNGDCGPFRESGAWQTAPMLMRGVFLDDIRNIDSSNGYPFPTWTEIISLACHTVVEPEHERVHDDRDDDRDDLLDDEEDRNENANDDDDEDEDEDSYLWNNEDDFNEGFIENNNFAPPSRLIQYAWPRYQNDDYYHTDVNHNWLDTFEINQFGPFIDGESLEKLLRREESENSTSSMSRTLLVNDVDRWFPKLSRWMDRRFNDNTDSRSGILPARWRRDDGQISLSYKTGGIGPHVDDYDVFLIQIDGERTWDVLWDDEDEDILSFVSVQDETDCILPESSANGVRILNVTKLQTLQQQRFGKTATKLTRLCLRPGDCLYLPPRVLHCGTAISESKGCMTLSVGCRAPSALELFDGLSDLMKKAAITTTTNAMAMTVPMLPSDATLQSFHKRYTNTDIYLGEDNCFKGNDHPVDDKIDLLSNKDTLKPLSSLSSSSWLSPNVKNVMKNLVLDAVRTALDDDENVLDPLVGKFVTRSNRLEEDDFDYGSDSSLLSSFSYPKPLRDIIEKEWSDEKKIDEWKREFDIWTNASDAMKEVFREPVAIEGHDEKACFRRAEGIAFAWSSVYDKERRVRKYRLYAQGRPPFEVLEAPVIVSDEVTGNAFKQSIVSTTPDSIVGRLMDRIVNGQPLNREFVVDELKICIVDEEKDKKYTVTRLLYELVEEGLLYGEYCDRLGRIRRGQWAGTHEDYLENLHSK